MLAVLLVSVFILVIYLITASAMNQIEYMHSQITGYETNK